MERICKKCGKAVVESGFVFNDGEYYYCSEECMLQDMTEQEYIDLYESGAAYWTEWQEQPLGYFDSGLIAARFFAERYNFWRNEGKADAMDIAIAEVSELERDPFEPSEMRLDRAAVKAVAEVAKHAASTAN